MKRIFSFLAAAAFAFLATAPAQATWTFTGNYANGNSNNNRPIITDGNWNIILYNKSGVGVKDLPSGIPAHIEGGSTVLDLRNVNSDLAEQGWKVTGVDYQGFMATDANPRPELTEVYLPETCVSIGEKAFQYCKSLEIVCLSSQMGAFTKSHAFSVCKNLKTVYYTGIDPVEGAVILPATVTSLMNNTFEMNSGNINTAITSVVLPGVTLIDGYCFQYCKGLRNVYAPLVTNIGGCAFLQCSALETMTIGANFDTLANNNNTQHFNGCTALKTITPYGTEPEEGVVRFPDSLTAISGWGSFYACKGIVHFIAEGVTNVGNRAFRECTGLKTMRLSPNLTLLDTNGTSSDNSALYKCTALEDFYPSTFASDFTVAKCGMFRDCTALTNYLDLSATSATEIPSMWASYSALAGVTFPATLSAFTGDQNFRELKAGAKFRFLGDRPTVTTTADKSPFYTKEKNNVNQRHVFVVDAAAYPAWTNGTDFVAMDDIALNNDTKNAFLTTSADFPATKYPDDIAAEEVLGATIWGSGNGRYNWVVQYVDHSRHDVTWVNDGATYDTTRVEVGAAPTAPDGVPAKASTAQYDYVFLGWNTDENAAAALDLSALTINAATTFYAIYRADVRSYAITWKLDAETVLDTTTVLYGVVPTHADASKEADGTYSYRFDGWSTDGETVLKTLPAVTGAATYIAVFTPLSLDTSVTVSWFDEDGTTPLDPATTTVEKGAKPTHAEPAKAATVDTAYTFEGWTQVGGDGTVVYTTANLPAASANVSYKAVYSSATRQYTVTFANWDGTIVAETLYDYNTPATAVIVPECPLRPATAEYTYAFTGWSPAAVADVVSDATYTAQYSSTPNEYTAIFVNGQTGETVSSVALAYGSAVTAPEPPEVDGYTFVKWSPAVDTMPPANTTYTAIYTINKYTITWKNANGATLSTTTVEHGAMPAYGGTAPSLSNTSKLGYTFTGWTPEIVAATEATTYTAAYKVAFLSPMTIALDSAAYDKGTGEATVVTEVGNTDAAATTTAEATAQFRTVSVTGESTVDGTTVTNVFDNFASGRGYEWTITATQTYGAEYSGASESASIKGRTYARAAKSWFGNDDVSWNEGAFAPTGASGSGAQVRMRAMVTFPAVLPRALPVAENAAVGITACQPNAGVAPRYYAWNGSQWVKLVGVAPKGGVAVNLLGVVDFARKDGAAVAWYADGFQLTTEAGDWEVPLAGGANLEFFKRVGDFSVESLSSDYDIGGLGFRLLVR